MCNPQVLSLWMSETEGPEQALLRMAALQRYLFKAAEAPAPSKALLESCCLEGYEPWRQWWEKEYKRLLTALISQSRTKVDAARRKVVEIMTGLGSLPPSSKEGVFRAALQERMSGLSSSSTFLKKKVEQMQALCDLLSAAGPNGEAQQEAERLKQSMAEAKALSQGIVTTLCFFAALALFRSSAIGGKSEQSKKAATDLNSLLLTLLTEMEGTHPCMWLDEETMAEVLLQMGETVPSLAFAFS